MQIVIASIHKRHKLDEDRMTRRLVAVIGHPLLSRSRSTVTRAVSIEPALARRAWIRRSEVLNALPADEFCARVKPRR